MEWIDSKGGILYARNVSMLKLTVTPIDSDSLQYTCRVTSQFGNQNQTAFLSILSTSTPSTSVAVPASIVAVVLSCALLIVVIAIILIVR